MGNSCINLSSQSFKDLVQESGKDPIELAADINIWADKNPSIDTWPTVKELYEKNQNEDTQYSKLTQEEKARTIEEVTKQHRSITVLKDLSAKLAWRIGGKVEFVNKTDVNWKGSNQGMNSVLNEAYMTPDTPFHEIMAHPIIRVIKNKKDNNVNTTDGKKLIDSFNSKLKNIQLEHQSDMSGTINTKIIKNGKTIGIISFKFIDGKFQISLTEVFKEHQKQGIAEDLYIQLNTIGKELGLGVLHSDTEFLKDTTTEQWTLDGKALTKEEKRAITDNIDKLIELDEAGRLGKTKAIQPAIQLWEKLVRKDLAEKFKDGYRFKSKNPKNTTLYENLLKELETGRGKEVFEQVKRDYKYKYLPEKTDSDYGNYKIKVSESGAKYFDTLEEANKALEEYAGIKYTLEEQQEEAIVTLLSLYAADKIDKVEDKKLWGYLKDLWNSISDFVKGLLKQDGIKIDKLPITTTLDDLANIMAYGNNKIILPGYKVEYQTPLGNKYDTLEEVNNERKTLIDTLEDIDLDFEIEVDNEKQVAIITNKKGVKIESKPLYEFIQKDKKYAQSKEIITYWLNENDIVYDPEEVYSRGQGFYSSIGAYSNLELDLLFQNLLQHIEDNKKAGGEFTISAFTKPIESRLKHIEGTEGKVRFKIFPQSQDIKWAAPTDVYSGSVWDAHEKVSKDKKSELLGVSFTKAPSLNNVNQVSPNLADIIDNLSHAHNELGIELTPTNFRIEYDSDLPYESKKLIDNINKILDNKYGKMQVSVIERQNIESTIFKEISELELLKKEDWAAPDHIDLFSKKDKERLEYLKNFIKTGKQPTKTKDNVSSIESVKKRLQNLTPEQLLILDKKVEDGEITDEEEYNAYIFNNLDKINKKEYIKQALNNLRIAKLKEVARKYPRSLIISKVVPIDKNLVDNSEIQYSKINTPIKEGVKELFEQFPELSNIGTQEQYNDYIAKISLGIISKSENKIQGFKEFVDGSNKFLQKSGSLQTLTLAKIENLQSTVEYQLLNEKDEDLDKKAGQSYMFLSKKDAERFTYIVEKNKEFPKEFKVTKKITKYERDVKNPLNFNSYNEYIDFHYIKSNKNKKSNLYDIVNKETGEVVASKVRVLSVSKDSKSEIAQKYGLEFTPTKVFSANRSIAFALYRQKPSKAKYVAQAKKYLYDALKFLNKDETALKINLDKIESLLNSFPEEMWNYINTTYSPEDSTNINASTSLQNEIKFNLPKLGLLTEIEKVTKIKLQGASFKNYDRSGRLAKVFKFSKLDGKWGNTIIIDSGKMTTKELKASISYYLKSQKYFKESPSSEENVRKYAEHRGIDYNELRELVFGDIDKALDNISHNTTGNSDTIELSKWRESIREYDWQTVELFSKPYENFQNTVKERITAKFKDKNLSNGISHLDYFFNSKGFNWLNINFNNISGQYYTSDMETEANVGVETKMGGIINPFEIKIYQKPKAGENFLQEKEVFNRLAAVLHEPFHALHALSYGTKEEIELKTAFDTLYETDFGKEMMKQVFSSGYNKRQQVSYDTLYKEFTAFTTQLMLYPKEWITKTDLRSNDIYDFILKIQTLQDKTYEETVKTQQKIGTTEKTIIEEEQIKLLFLEKLYNYLVKALNKIIPLSKKFTSIIAESKLVEKQVIEDVFGIVEETVTKQLKLPDTVKNSKEEFLQAMEELQSAITTLMQIDSKLFSSENLTNFFTSNKFNQKKGKQDVKEFKEYVNQSNNNNNLTVNSKKTVDNNVKSKDLLNSLNKAIESLGIKIETVEYLKNKEGQIDKTLTAEAKIVKTVEGIQKVISFVNGKESFEILSEEVAHIFTGLLGFNHPLYQSLEKQIVKYPEYEQVKKDYPELTNEKDIKFEAIGQLIGNNIVELAQKKSKNSLLQNIWDAIIRFLQKSGIAKPNEFQQIALNLLNDNLNQYKLQEIEQENQIIANAKKKQPRKFTRLDWQDEAKQSREYWEKKAKKEKKYSKKIPLQNALSLNSENDNNAVKNKPENQKVNWQQFKKVTPKFTTDISLNPESIKQIKDVLSDTMPDFFYLDAADLQWMAEKCADGTFKLTCQI